MNVLALLRNPRFSPNSEENDRAILLGVAEKLRLQGHSVTMAAEEQHGTARPDAILSMGREPATLDWLRAQRCPVINRPEAVERCGRSRLVATMQQLGIPLPPARGDNGYWLKRGDAAAQERGDVVFARDEARLQAAIAQFGARGVADYVVQAHVEGDLLKFYGVLDTPFFRTFYPTDDGLSKFGDERRNGAARHFPYSLSQLRGEATRLARAIGLQVYGGDAVVSADGTFCIIDFNDWPSFSRCRDEAATAIASLVERGAAGPLSTTATCL